MSERRTDDPSAADHDRLSRINDVLFEHVQRRSNGENVSDDALIAQHPDLMPELAERLHTLGEVANHRAASEADMVARAESESRSGVLAVHCPHCHERIQLPVDASFSQITCSSCGSRFSLAGDETVTHRGPMVRHLAHFELIEQLGVGSFGTVWKARDTKLDRTVAVKIPRQGQLAPDEVEQFLREARAAAQLNHSNIVAVHEVGRDADTVYIVSDLVRGVSLADCLTAKPPSFRETAELCAKIAMALEHAHEAGVVHRDLKPQNIMLDGQFEPHLMDFGLARRDVGETTMTIDGRVLGTPAYMSPEQARGEAHQADRRTDVYSLGVILFELLTGELPFRGTSRMMLYQVLHEDAPSPRKLNNSVSKDLETVCLKCLEKEPEKRYDSASEVAKELRRFLRHEPVHARPVTPAARTWRWCRRNPLIASLAASAAILLVAVASVASVAYFRVTFAHEQVDQQRSVAERLAYYGDMNEAGHVSVEPSGLGRVRQLMQFWIPKGDQKDLRGWEWYYLYSLCHRDLFTAQQHSGAVDQLTWSQDGERVTSIGRDGKVMNWNLNTGESTRLVPPVGQVSTAAWSKSSFRLASTSADGKIKIQDISGRQTLSRDHDAEVTSLTWSRDAQWLASAGGNRIKIWHLFMDKDARYDDEPMTLEEDADVGPVALSPDGQRLAFISEDRGKAALKLWNVTRPHKLIALSDDNPRTHALAWSPNGNWLASADHDGTVRIWDPTTLGVPNELQTHTAPVRAVSWSWDSKRLASASSDGTIQVWDPGLDKPTFAVRGHDRYAVSLSWHPNGEQFASGGVDGEIKIWDVGAHVATSTFRHDQGVWALAWGPNGSQLALSSWDGSVKILDAVNGEQQHSLPPRSTKTWSGLFSHDDRVWGLTWDVGLLASAAPVASAGAEGEIELWNPVSWEKHRHSLQKNTERILCVAISPNGERLAVAASDGTINIRETETWHETDLPYQHSYVLWLCWSPDGQQLASASWDNTIKIWNAMTGVTLTLPGHTGHATCLCWSPDGKQLASASWDWTARIWDAQTGDEVHNLRHTNRVNSVSWSSPSRSPGRDRLASASDDGAVRIWDPITGRQTLTLRAHTGRATAVVWHPALPKLASAGVDGTVKIWDATRGYETAQQPRGADQ